MTRRIAIVLGHPDRSPDRLCRAFAVAYAEGAREAGHVVDIIDLAALDFPLLKSQQDFLHGALPDVLKPAQEAVTAAEHVVFIYPLWLGTMPALLKGFLEQLLRPGVAFAYKEKGFPEMLLKGKSARVIVTMGMPALIYRLWFLSHSLRSLRRHVLKFVGFSPVRETLFGAVEEASEEKRKSWIEEVRVLGKSAL
ncbi:MAG: NAD(P)H-dependent oxidoreductase [Nitratireductor sp.]|uniref:NAD(P)H-dependent oxidoreductase n=1 Tax=Nitratireductor sp. TaxID=1872084 RepID=UPI00261DB69F|nr:NAD(P)H-dependent oxidoreductase [Nitratireductor sp.]MCV0349551.1 NAD(P)H-dependent oxidoreductase [Nitratireductor sp.]